MPKHLLLFLLILFYLPLGKSSFASASTLSFKCSGTITKFNQTNVVNPPINRKVTYKYSHIVLIDLKNMRLINKDDVTSSSKFTITKVTPQAIYFLSNFIPKEKIGNLIEIEKYEGTFNKQGNFFSSVFIDSTEDKDSRKYTIFKVITNTNCVRGT